MPEYRAFYQAKIKTARFYIQRILPRASGHATCVVNGAYSMMALEVEEFFLGQK
ncbi:acyl-CoA dehydrogenase C-terminal domain-containing protein [Colwellia demingiae]|uniref:acyl-CoA dehydrogenase C-terminal domain-containing protein n=1 Tax=Colwellia demingiae TaxID=89401 RepID=UPI001B87F985|nr:acyl-CoA dehydrogenase C-terminal domain-containing protein [Colwellia demingiae]